MIKKVDLMERNANHVIPPYCHLSVIWQNGFLQNYKPQIVNLLERDLLERGPANKQYA